MAESFEVVHRRMKRLLSAMQCGVVVSYGDGHRWIYCYEVSDNELLDERVRAKTNSPLNYKVYGSIDEALDRADEWLAVVGGLSLEEQYDRSSELFGTYNGWGLPKEEPK